MKLFGWRLVRIRGRSMEPMLRPGCFVLFRPARQVRPGDIVLVKHAEFGLIVKQVERVMNETIHLSGLSPFSTSTERLGAVSAKRICGLHVVTLQKPRAIKG